MPEPASSPGLSTAANWAEVGERLVAYAVWLGRNRVWGCRDWDNLGMGCSAEDLVREVITDLLAGRCDFDPARGELVPYLKQRLKWKFINLGKAAAVRREQARSDPETGGPGLAGQEDATIAREYLARLRERVLAHMAVRKRKFDLTSLFDAIVEQGEADVDSLVARFGLQRDQIYYQLRVLRSLAHGLDEEVENGGQG